MNKTQRERLEEALEDAESELQGSDAVLRLAESELLEAKRMQARDASLVDALRAALEAIK